ncbi:IclR family transcriptional regulator [Bauldia sp.]|uniref:IclR family transcriptional regulator n=1 Tax=Bauldia sp. TaxID=2575872 RepID=UPI003BA93D4F
MSEDVRTLETEAPPTAEASPSRPAYRVPAAEKALDILEFMAGRPEGVTQTEISAGLGRSIHEIYRVIQLLERRGYLVRAQRSDRYRLSLKLFELAHQHPPVNQLVDVALPVMRSLAADSDQSCHLAVLNGTQILIVLQADSPLPMRYSVAIGSQFPILETSSGAVLLACMPEASRDHMTELLIAADSAIDGDALRERLAAIDLNGFEMRTSLAVDGCINISLPIRDHLGTAVAALTVPFLPQTRARMDHEAVLRCAQTAALEISRALGAPDHAGKPAGDNKERPHKP